MNDKPPWVLILAGGEGTRLQELTRQIAGWAMPKQYCRIHGSRTLLETTLQRTAHLAPASRTLVIVNLRHLDMAIGQLTSLPATNILVQPCNRDTGPGIVLSLLHLAKRDPDAVVAMFPSDHFVDEDERFLRYVAAANRLVADHPDEIALLGIQPERPDVELGYVNLGAPVAGDEAAFRVTSFVEKPDREQASRLLREGALWNSFVMVFRVGRMLELLGDLLPVELEGVRRVAAGQSARTADFARLEAWNFSTHFLARIPADLVAIRVEGIRWSDWGTRAAVERTLLDLNQPPPWLRGRQAPSAA